MERQFAYQFPSNSIANRFLNQLRSGSIAGVNARLHIHANMVRVSFCSDTHYHGFDDRLALLDQLAIEYNGNEIDL